MMNINDAKEVINGLQEKPFICSENAIETNNGFVIKRIPKKYSNADKIRSMNDEKLAEFLERFEVCSHCEYSDKERCTFENPCVHEFATAMALKWLQSEAE